MYQYQPYAYIDAATPFERFLGRFYDEVFRPGMSSWRLKKMAQNKWKTLKTPAEAEAFFNMTEEELERLRNWARPIPDFSVPMANYSGKIRRRVKKVRDPNAPKPATTAFFLFTKEARDKVKQANPDFKVTDVAKKLGECWHNLGSEEKERFKEMAAKDRQRYKDEMKIFIDANKAKNEATKNEEED